MIEESQDPSLKGIIVYLTLLGVDGSRTAVPPASKAAAAVAFAVWG